jgi:hypothetical protein
MYPKSAADLEHRRSPREVTLVAEAASAEHLVTEGESCLVARNPVRMAVGAAQEGSMATEIEPARLLFKSSPQRCACLLWLLARYHGALRRPSAATIMRRMAVGSRTNGVARRLRQGR